MASLHLLNKKYWYIKSKGQFHATGYTKAFSKLQIRQKISKMRDGERLKALLFDNLVQEKVTVDYAIAEYSLTKNGTGPDGKSFDENQERNFRRVTKSAFDRILKEFSGRYLNEISDSDILRWMQKLRAEGLMPESVKRYVNTFSPIFTHGKSKYRNWCTDNPIMDEGAVQKEFKTNKGVWDYQGREVGITDQEAKAFLEVARGISKWFYLLMLLNFNVGARRREMLTLKRKDVDLEAKRFVVLTINAKVKKPRSVFYGFAPEIGRLMAETCEGKTPNDYVFSLDGASSVSETCVYENFNKTKVAAGLPEMWTFRDFRHIASQRMNAEGVPLNVIADAMGTSVKLLEKTYLKQPRTFAEEIMMKKLAA